MIDLWLFAGQERRDGIVTVDDMDATDWKGDPEALIALLVDEKWLDDLEDGRYHIHDWEEIQPHITGYEDFCEEQSKKAKKGWKTRRKSRKKTKAVDTNASGNATGIAKPKSGNAPSVPTNLPTVPTNKSTSAKADPPSPKEIVTLWNSICGTSGLSRVRSLTDERRSKIKLRYKVLPAIQDWVDLFHKIANSDFCRGGNDKNWTASFDWILIKDGNPIKILEGNYDNRKSANAYF